MVPVPLELVVALGASAGGLQPLRSFFAASIPDPRVAYLIVTHLPPRHVSHLPELLDRIGSVPVEAATDGRRLEGARAYVCPPGRLLRVEDGTIRLDAQPARPPSPKPIDALMLSLARGWSGRCAGIVLSGTDHDGTLGLTAIRAAGGLTVVQRPDTAEFPSMPQSAVAAGVVDRQWAPSDMPGGLAAHLAGLTGDPRSPPDAPGVARGSVGAALSAILAAVRVATGQDFRHYKPGMLGRRVERRMALAGLGRVDDYLALLDRSADEAAALKDEFLIGFTAFFRDEDVWEELRRTVVPALLEDDRPADATVRVWTAGCATGEESYSIAMLLLERAATLAHPPAVQVFATDIDDDALAIARAGTYPAEIAEAVGPERLARFFERVGDRYVVRPVLRDAVLFARQNVGYDTPFSKLDLVLCRNVLIYFESNLQERVFEVLHFALRPQGWLLLGKAESIGAGAARFDARSRTARLFRRLGARGRLPTGFTGGRTGPSTPVPPSRRGGPSNGPTAGELLDAHVAGRAVTAAVLVDRAGRALHFRGAMTPFLDPRGEASLELPRLVRHELRTALRGLLRDAVDGGRAARFDVRWTAGTASTALRVAAEPLAAVDGVGLLAVTFEFAAPPPEVQGLEPPPPEAGDLELGGRALSAVLDEAERDNEALRLANEEGLALNEELQAANEELEASKEELQALNEELAALALRLEDKVAEEARGRDDLENLLESTRIPTILLDRTLQIRRFTPGAAEHFGLRAGDEGRPLDTIAARTPDPAFAAEVGRVLATGERLDAELDADGGRAVIRRLRPYLMADGRVDGVVVTYVDVTATREAARQARELVAMMQDSHDAVVVHDPEGRILSWSAGAERLYGRGRDEAVSLGMLGLVPPSARQAERARIERTCADGRHGPVSAERLAADGGTIRVSVTASALRSADGTVRALLSTERDLTEQLRSEAEMRFRRLADLIPALLRVDDVRGDAEFVNQSCVAFGDRPLESLLGHGWFGLIHPEDLEGYAALHARATGHRTRLETDLRMRRADGAWRWMRSVSVPRHDADGTFAGHVALTLDIDERHAAEDALQAADRRKDEYLAMLAHELRNPLAPIRNAVAIIGRRGHADPPTGWAVDVISRQTGALSRLLDDLLDVARIARGKVVLARTPIALSALVERAVETARPAIDARRHRLTVALPAVPLTIDGDLLRLTQVLANLLDNAAKYSDEEGWIRIDAQPEGAAFVAIRVSDGGVGMAPDVVARVFDLFEQADTSLDRANGGLGLGLTLVRRLVELHAGSVEAQSDGPGRGSCFTLRLPRALPPPGAPRGPGDGTDRRSRRERRTPR